MRVPLVVTLAVFGYGAIALIAPCSAGSSREKSGRSLGQLFQCR